MRTESGKLFVFGLCTPYLCENIDKNERQYTPLRVFQNISADRVFVGSNTLFITEMETGLVYVKGKNEYGQLCFSANESDSGEPGAKYQQELRRIGDSKLKDFDKIVPAQTLAVLKKDGVVYGCGHHFTN